MLNKLLGKKILKTTKINDIRIIFEVRRIPSTLNVCQRYILVYIKIELFIHWAHQQN